MLEIVRYGKKHIPSVKKLYDRYLIPQYLRHMGITKDEVTKEIIELEWMLHPDVTAAKYYEPYSVVCIDKSRENKVIGCSMAYTLDEQQYYEGFLEKSKQYLNLKNQPESVRDYAKNLINSYGDLNLFEKYNAKKIFYWESVAISPFYRQQNVGSKMIEFSEGLTDKDIKIMLGEMQVPPEDWKGNIDRFKIRPENEIVLKESFHNDFLCFVILRLLNK